MVLSGLSSRLRASGHCRRTLLTTTARRMGSRDHSYEYLYDAVDRHLKRTRQQRMREALSMGAAGEPNVSTCDCT